MNIEQAKQIPLEEAMQHLGLSPTRARGNTLWYLSPFRDESEASFKVNRALNAWYDFGDSSGGDVIDLVRKLYRLNGVSAALARLDEIMGATRPKPIAQPGRRESAPAMELLRNEPIRSRSLIAYLRQRGIDVNVARHYLRELHYRSNAQNYFALGFANDDGGFELRNPYFKGTYGHKSVSTISGSDRRVWVFEGFLDFLTAATMLHGKIDGTVIVLNSVAMKDKAVEIIRELKPSTVELYRDNDKSGEQLFAYFQRNLPEPTIVDWSSLYAGYNDLNEWHVRARHAGRSSAGRQ